MSANEPFGQFEWLLVHYQTAAGARDFQQLSGYERWLRLRDQVRQAHARTGQGGIDALDRVKDELKPQLLSWLDARAEASDRLPRRAAR